LFTCEVSLSWFHNSVNIVQRFYFIVLLSAELLGILPSVKVVEGLLSNNFWSLSTPLLAAVARMEDKAA